MNITATSASDDTIWIIYGSHTGNGERLAAATQKRLISIGMTVRSCDMSFFDPAGLQKIHKLLLIVSTHGIGEPPVAALEFHEFVMGTTDLKLTHLKFAVLALGDTGYAQFCQTGKELDQGLERLGATRLLDRVDLDVDFESGYWAWLADVTGALTQNQH
jgi:sulfite reductase (NADPH) flavoprotein alpha-component